MISLIVPILFFFILVLLYPAVSLVLSISAWLLKQWEGKRNIKDETVEKRIDKKRDDLKDLMFIILVFLTFFFISPLALFYLMEGHM